MPNAKLSAGTLATSLAATDRFPLAQGSLDRVGTPKLMLDYIEGVLFPSIPAGNILHYSFAQGLQASGFTVVIGTYYGVPFMARPGDTITGVALEITAAPTIDGNIRIGLYANDPLLRKPPATGGLIYDSGNIAFTTTSFALSTTPVLVPFPVAQVVPDDGHLWVVLQSDTASSMQWRRASAVYGHNKIPRTNGAGALSNTNNDAGLTVTGAFGAMPANAPALAQSATSPAIALYRS
jgi:hypothetical protein